MALANAPGMANLTGAVLSRRYVLKHEIGRGGMGAVYAAEHVDGTGPVAIKLLHPFFVADETVMTRFLEEGRTCMRLLHPNILRVHECLAAEDGSPYLVMDLLEGIPLSAYTKNGGRVGLPHAIPILQGILLGLEAAHAMGIVHRDLKPGNVFLARSGGVFSVKLLDFGIAKVMDAAGGMGSKTSTGALLGTPAYMSPEQVKSAKDVDGRSDLWSVGVMFYEMLTGRVAFPAPTEYARLAAVISAKPVPIAQIDPQLALVSAFMDRALEKDRERRFQTAREMAATLAALMPTDAFVETGNLPRAMLGLDTGNVAMTPPPNAIKVAASAWELVADKPASAGEIRAPSSPPLAAKDPLAMTPDHASTLASPNRPVLAPSHLPSHPPPEVVIATERELADARDRETFPRIDLPPAPPRKVVYGVQKWVVVVLVILATTVGFALGYAVALYT
jgi:serine/threonine protein kinase